MRRKLTVVSLAAVALTVAGLSGAAGAGGKSAYEVWAVDQSNTNGTTSGGALYVYDGGSLETRGAAAVPERIDLGGATTALCLASTGTAPVRPHMLLFDEKQSHAILSFVASGHVVFFDARSRAPLACIDVGLQAHAAVPAPDRSYVVVANQNGKLVQRISTDYRTNTFTLDAAATLNLAAGTTPSGALREDPALRPDNAPICPIVDESSRFTFLTLRGGGLFVLDSRATPMRIVAEYDRTAVHGNGCGGIENRKTMYINSGGGTAANMSEFDVYAFDLRQFSTTPAAPNTPTAKLVVSQDDRMDTDSHGPTLTGNGRHLWVADRAGNRIVVIKTANDRVLGELSLVGPFSDDPSPDLLDTSPSGDYVFASLRGALPLSGDPHASTGSTPGVGVIRVSNDGKTGSLVAIARIANVDAAGIDRADPHGLRIREK